MTSFFLSDAHLRTESDPRYRKLLSFLKWIKGRADRLYLAGDFFDFWFCSDHRVYPEYVSIISSLRDLKESGTRICLCEGNHDFYLASYFRDKLGMEVYPEWADIALDGRRILLAHGDTVDRTNTRYLFLRHILRSGAFCRFQRVIPAALRWKLAALSSDLSKGMAEVSKDRLVAVMEAFAMGKFEEGYDAVVLGHSHRPLLKLFTVRGRSRLFVSLGDWIEHFSYLCCHNGEFRLEFFES